MSVDGRDGSPGDGDAEAGGTTAPQVPSQGGRGASGVSGASSGSGVSGPDAFGAAGSGGEPEGSVPAQWDRRDDDAVLPPLRDAPPSDAELIARMRAGQDSAYEELYRRHADAVRRYARTCCRDGHTADDLTAEVFARMLQAVRGGSGPEYAVRAYLLTSVRRVAAHWTRSAKREQLVDDFAVFAAEAAGRPYETADDDTLELGADVRAMHEAERSMAMQAFRSLPERWQAVLWHTEVEDESPSQVATLFGLDANGTRVLASRAREGLKQAYLQAHVSTTLTSDEECSRYADQLGTYARKRLRTRAERGVRKHLAECARCRLAAMQIEEVAGGIPAVVPLAVIGWFGAAGYAKAAGLVAGGVGVGAAGVGGAAAAANGSSASGGAAASEGLGAPAKVGIAAGVVVAAAAAAWALTGSPPAHKPPVARPASSAPVVREEPPPSPAPSPDPTPPAPKPPVPKPAPTPSPKPSPSPSLSKKPVVVPPPSPTPTPSPSPSLSPTPAAPVVYPLNQLAFNLTGDGTGPEIRLGGSSWVWQRDGLSIADRRYARGVTVRGSSSVTIDLNRACTSYDALVGVDDTTLKLGQVYFSVYADGARVWRSGLVKGGDPAVPVHVGLVGRKSVRLVVEPYGTFDELVLADWAESKFVCS